MACCFRDPDFSREIILSPQPDTMSTQQYSQFAHVMSDTVDKTKMFVDMDQSKAYAENRPRYTDELFKTVVDFCKETNPNLNLAVDVGCGPGMSTIGFAKYFKKVRRVFFSSLSSSAL